MKQKKYLKKILVVLLCYAMLPFSVPASAVNEPETATELAQIATTDTGIAMDETIAADDNAVLVKPEGAEVVSLREESVKHFDMGNGTYQAISYSHPVHELDSEGNWQDIDFSMHLTQTRGISTYTNTAGTALAANYIANQPILSMSGEDTAIDMTFIYAKEGVAARAGTVTTAVAEVTQAETAIETYEDTQDINFSNTLYYKDVMPGVDLEYIVDPWNVKENIIVKEKALSYTYMFKLNLEGMYPVLQQDGSIFVLNSQTDEKEYVIPAPYMYDAYGEMSFDVDYTVSGSNGTYYLSVTADSTWINAADRIFPITIDPSIYTANQSVNMDTYINEDTPDEPRGLYKFFFVGENEVAYIYTPTPTIPQGGYFGAASLKLHYFYKDHVRTGYVDFTAHLVTDFYWAQESLTWNNVVYNPSYFNNPNYETYGLEPGPEGPAVRVHAALGATSAAPKPVNVNVTNAVRQWIDGTITNNGIGLLHVEDSPNRSVMFRSTEGHVNYRPVLEVSYYVYEVNVILEYDQAYENQCGGETATLRRIDEMAGAMATFYLNNFNILVHYGTANKIATYTDQCSTFAENGVCTCSGRTCLVWDDLIMDLDACHHSSLNAILWDLEEPPENVVRMVFTGHDTCYFDDDKKLTCTNAYKDEFTGASDEGYRSIVIADHGDKNAEITTVIHEMGHMFGTDDHYKVFEWNLGRDGCIYGYNGVKCDDPEALKLCSVCHTVIMNNRGRFCG